MKKDEYKVCSSSFCPCRISPASSTLVSHAVERNDDKRFYTAYASEAELVYCSECICLSVPTHISETIQTSPSFLHMLCVAVAQFSSSIERDDSRDI